MRAGCAGSSGWGNELNVRSEPGSEYASFQDLALGLIGDVLRAGQQSGEFHRDVLPAAVARAIFAWIVGVDTLFLPYSTGKDLEQRTEGMLALLLPALASDAPGPADPDSPPQLRPRSANSRGAVPCP